MRRNGHLRCRRAAPSRRGRCALYVCMYIRDGLHSAKCGADLAATLSETVALIRNGSLYPEQRVGRDLPGISVSIRCSVSIRALPSLISLSSFLHGGFTRATSAPGLGSPLPHLRRDWAHRCHICTGTELTVAEAASYTAAHGPHSHRCAHHARALELRCAVPHAECCGGTSAMLCAANSARSASLQLSGEARYSYGAGPN